MLEHLSQAEVSVHGITERSDRMLHPPGAAGVCPAPEEADMQNG